MKKIKFITVLLLLIQTLAFSQDKLLKGVVTDQGGEPLPGVTVRIVESGDGVVTDIDGQFSINVSNPDSRLEFSYLGMKNKIVTVGNQSEINIQLEDEFENLSEVVVTALGIERDKKSLGYASQQVDGESLITARENNLINSLSGRVAGMQINKSGNGPGGTSKVVVRGYTSIDGQNSPLYVVDGVPMLNPQGGGGQFGGLDYGDGISNINPDDVESINVLKGASATALYGSRGQNGVIMITTKSGKNRDGIGVTINSNLTVEEPLVLPRFQDRFGRGSNGNFPVNQNNQFSNVTRTSWGSRTLGQEEVGGVPLRNWTGELAPYSAQPNNVSDFFRRGYTLTNSVALTGGNDKTQARFSFTHLQNEGIMPNSNMERYNFNLNIQSKLSDRLTVSAKANYIKQEAFNRPNLTLSPDNPMNSLIQMPRSINLDDLRDFRTADGRPRVYTNAQAPDQWQNPFWATYLNTNNDTRDRLIGFVKLDYLFSDWLKMHVRTGTDFFNDFRQNRNATGTIYRVTPDRSFYSQYNGRFEEINTDILFTASNNIGDKINISSNLGANLLDERNRALTNTVQGLNIPDFFVMQNALSVISQESIANRQVFSVYGSIQASYDTYLFLEATARNDWSSSLPSANRSYFYPAVSGSFVFSEAFDLEWGAMDFGKFRGSIAQVGNDTRPHRLDLLYSVNNLSHGGQTFGQIIGVQPPVNLLPERTTSVEFGLDFGFFQNRLSTEITYYNASTRNQILQIPVSKASGFNSSLINAGMVNNYGIEVAIRATPIKTKDFVYDTYLNLTRNRSEIKELAPEVEIYQLGGNYDQFGVRIQAEVGRPFGDIYADRAYLRDENTGQRIIGSNGLPVPDPEGIKRVGNFQPDLLWGFGHNFKYKNFSVNMLFDGRLGGDIFSFTNAISAANGNALYTLDGRQEWYAGAGGYVAEGIRADGSPNTTPVNPQTYWQFVGGQASTFAEEFIYDGTFIKFRELSISYRIPNSLTQRAKIEAASISLVGRDLFFLHKRTVGFDPESTFNAGNDQGIEAFAFPSTRSLGLNLNLRF